MRNAQIGYDNSAIGMFEFILLHMYLPNQVFIQPNKILFFDILISVEKGKHRRVDACQKYYIVLFGKTFLTSL